MLKIRLQRIGKKNDPSFRVVLVEHTMRPQGKFIELLGSYNKVQKQKNFNKERILYWISKGAQLSSTMNNLLVDEKIIDKEKVKAWRAKQPAVSPEGKQAGPPSDKSESIKTDSPQSESLGEQSEGLGGEAPKVEEASKVEEVKVEEPKLDTQEKKE